VQLDAPAGEKNPLGQAVQLETPEPPTADRYVPAAHFTHALAL